MPCHKDWDRLQTLWPSVVEFQSLASEHGISDVFQDNGGKVLQMLLALDLKEIPGRHGNDAVDAYGIEYELKSVNIRKTSSFSTHHHLNQTILAKYRNVDWVFAIFEDIELQSIYKVEKEVLTVFFDRWEAKLALDGKSLNNPKIPISFVLTNGTRVYDIGDHTDLKMANPTVA